MKHYNLDLLTYWRIITYKYNVENGLDPEDALSQLQDTDFYIQSAEYCVIVVEGNLTIELKAKNGVIESSDEINYHLINWEKK